jgi:hypothetical protein
VALDPTEFESDVRELLRLQGWRVSAVEVVGHKKVDSYAERLDQLGAIQRVAVECKAWGAPLSQRDLTLLYANYRPLVDANIIDIILVVTDYGLAPSAAAFVSETRFLRHLTYKQLLHNLIDFRSYLQSCVDRYRDDPVSMYYVPQFFNESEQTLEDHLMAWITTSDCQPVAVLGGYGFGKTTIVKRLGYLLALRCAEDPEARIPIVLPLSAVGAEQTLEGLLGRQFTSVSPCPNYNYQLFLNLNARGRFVFFLDGFDEMKKIMSWDALLFNLNQLNQLVGPKTKAVLLGRRIRSPARAMSLPVWRGRSELDRTGRASL